MKFNKVFTTSAILSGLALLLLTGCAGTSNPESTTASSPDASATRGAAWGNYHLHVCFSNQTAEPVVLNWVRWAVNEDRSWADTADITLTQDGQPQCALTQAGVDTGNLKATINGKEFNVTTMPNGNVLLGGDKVTSGMCWAEPGKHFSCPLSFYSSHIEGFLSGVPYNFNGYEARKLNIAFIP